MAKKTKKAKIRRKSFAAREDLLDRMNKVAKENDLSLYGFVNHIFELALEANKLGVTLRTLIDSRQLLKDARENGYTLGLESLWYEMADLAYDKAKKKSLQSWFDAGVWLAKRYVTGESNDPFEDFKKDLKDFTWNIPELDLNKKADKVSVRIVSPRLPDSYTLLLTSFLEGALETFGYKIKSKEVSRGIICLESAKQ
ncbi:MAG: hypothetical protein CW691_05555 [Candidatus Bathyarchaeum sp.]|nr:MAG: hypothetical protein CW691_05555 [Candidatus Bathyarchaeum sp.]